MDIAVKNEEQESVMIGRAIANKGTKKENATIEVVKEPIRYEKGLVEYLCVSIKGNVDIEKTQNEEHTDRDTHTDITNWKELCYCWVII